MIIQGDSMKVLPTLPSRHFYTCITSPPYWGLRDYGIPPSEWPETTYIPMPGLPPITVPAWTGCLGLEPTPEMFVAHSVAVFREVWRVLRDDGTLWLNYGDSYAAGGRGGGGSYMDERRAWKEKSEVRGWRTPPTGLKKKDLTGIPWRVAFALQADGWYLRMDNIWAKPNPMPESTRDRPTKAHEYIFLLSKSHRYYYDSEAIEEPCVQDEWANGFRGGAYTGNETIDNSEGGRRKVKGNIKVPNGWDTGNGSHGTIHREGRTKGTILVGGSPGTLGPEHSRKRSGNKERKYGDGRGRPDSHIGASIPWEGSARNKRSVWTVATQPFPESHFATFPEKLIEPCILAGAPLGGAVFDPFGGSGTVEKVALENGRDPTIIEIGPQYVDIAKRRTAVIQPRLL